MKQKQTKPKKIAVPVVTTLPGGTLKRLSPYFLGNIVLALGLVFLVLVLLLVTSRGSNRLTSVQLRNQNELGAASYNQVITFEFTRPLSPELKGSIGDYISFEPHIEGVFRASDRSIVFSASQPLSYDTQYQVRVSPELKDSYGKPMAAGASYSFKTKPLQFLYATRAERYQNLELGRVLQDQFNADTAVRIESTRIASDMNIREYAQSTISPVLIYTVQNGEARPTDVYLYNIVTQETTKLDLAMRLNITAPVFAASGELMFIGTIPDEDMANLAPEELPENFSLPYTFDLETGKLERIEALASHYGDISAILPAPDGNTVLVQKFNFDLVPVSLLTGQSSPLGKFNAFGGFNYKGDNVGVLEISLGQVNFYPRAKVLGVEGSVYSTPDDIYARDPQISPSGGLFAFSARQETMELSEGRFGIRVVDYLDSARSLLDYQETGMSIELAKFSPERAFLAAEFIPKDILEDISRDARIYLNPGRPTSSELRLYDFKNNAWIKVGLGYNLLWVK